MSNQHFSVGEIAIYARPGSKYHGSEVTITGPAQIITDRCTETIRGHLCHEVFAPWSPWRYGPTCVRVEWLRKRRPPQDWVKLCNLTDVPREVEHV